MEFTVTFSYINPCTNKLEKSKIDICSDNIHSVNSDADKAILKNLRDKFSMDVPYQKIMYVGISDVEIFS